MISREGAVGGLGPAWKHDWFCISLWAQGCRDGRGRGNASRLITSNSGSMGSLTDGHRNNAVAMDVEGMVLDTVGSARIFSSLWPA